MFKSLRIEGWRQFRKVEIRFHPRLTVLTGANGAGKTTLLNLVGRHFGWGFQFISTPRGRDRSHPSLHYTPDLWDLDEFMDESLEGEVPGIYSTNRNQGPLTVMGMIEYTNGSEAKLAVQTDVGTASSYDVQIQGQQPVEGIHIPSHRATYSYQQVQNIPTVPRRQNDAYNQYINLIRTRYGGGHTQWSPQYFMKETLVSLATFGYGNEAVEADLESARIFREFQVVLKRMLPPSLGFKQLIVRVPEIILDTETGQFSIDALSGGASAVIDLAWQVFMFQPTGTQYVVTLDEPENHLHPELQRRVLADLLAAFPTVQFIVATHSPFIVGSVPESAVYALAYDETRSVVSHELDTVNKAGTANEILRDVLGLDFTMPIWVESRLSELVARYSDREFSQETLTQLRSEMAALGLANQIPQTIAELAAKKDER